MSVAQKLLHRSITVGGLAAISGAIVARLTPFAPGVVGDNGDWGVVCLIGAGISAVLGGALGAATPQAVRFAPKAALSVLATGVFTVLMALPVEGRLMMRVPLPYFGMVLGSSLAIWGAVRIGRHIPVLALGCAVLLTWVGARALAPPRNPASPRPPDILLVTVDTTRADLIPGFGGDRSPAKMPAIEAFGATARRFVRTFAPTALTGPSHTTLLSGVHVLDHGVVANGRPVPPALPWVPAALQHAGYRTAAFVSAAVLDADLGFSRGFDAFDSRFEQRARFGHPVLGWLPHRRSGAFGFVRPDDQTLDRALHYGIESAPDEPPRFTWIHLYGPHWPYEPDIDIAASMGIAPRLTSHSPALIPLNGANDLSPEIVAHGTALYYAELASLDRRLARILAATSPETRVVIVADHGESLDEHGLVFNHGPLAYAPDTRVPLWVRAPEFAKGTDERTVSTTHIAPTLVSLAGLDPRHWGPTLHEDAAQPVVSVSAASVFPATEPSTTAIGPWASIAIRWQDLSLAASQSQPRRWTVLSHDLREVHAPVDAPDDERTGPILSRWEEVVAAGEAPAGAQAPGIEAALEALGYLEPATP